MREGTERLLEVSHGLTVGRPRHDFLSCLSAVREGLLPYLASQGVVREPFALVCHLLPSKDLQGLDDTGMEHPPPLLQETAIGHFVSQGVLERVFAFGEQAGLIEELCRLQVGKAVLHSIFRHLGNGLQQGQRYLGANHRRRLQETLLLGWQSVDTCCQDSLYGGW